MPLDNTNRRKFIKTSGMAVVGTAFAGCLGEDSGDDDVAADDDDTDGDYFDEFDPENPHGSLPQTAQTLFDNGFNEGSEEVLQEFEERDEPVHGNAPLDVEETGEDYIDPDTIYYAYGQGEDAVDIYQDAFDPLIENIEEETGRDCEFLTLDDPTAVVEAMRAERLHVSSVGAGTTPYIVNIGGSVPFTMLVDEGTFGYRLWTTAAVDNDNFRSIDDLVGQEVAHTTETSMSGNLAPRGLLPDEEGITPDEDYEVVYSDGHEMSLRGIEAGDYEVGQVASSIFGNMYSAGEIDPEDFRVIWMSDPFPSLPTGYRYNLEPEIVEGIQAAHFDYDYSGTSIEEELGEQTFIEFDYATHHHPILQVHAELGIEYEVGDL